MGNEADVENVPLKMLTLHPCHLTLTLSVWKMRAETNQTTFNVVDPYLLAVDEWYFDSLSAL